MAFIRLKSGNIASATISDIYTVPSNSSINISRFLLTNKSTNDIGVDVYVNDGVADRLITSVTIPAGVGRGVNVSRAFDSYSGSDIIKLDPDSGDSFDYILSGRQS